MRCPLAVALVAAAAAQASPLQVETNLRGQTLGLGPQLSSRVEPEQQEKPEALDASKPACWDLFPAWGDGSACAASNNLPRASDLCTEQGWTCAAYERFGWCANGTHQRRDPGAALADEVCCACGGGKQRGTCEYFHSDLAREFRMALGRPDGFDSCAIVGSSGMLLHERIGTVIDSYELVMRFNLAPVQGFQDIIGSKTHARVLASEAAGVLVLDNCVGGPVKSLNSTACPDYALLVNSWFPSRTKVLKELCPNNRVVDIASVKHAKVGHELWPRSGNPFSGEVGTALATMVCRSVDVFGFTHKGNARFSSKVPFHYYDSTRLSMIDDMPESAVLLSAFAAGPGARCLRLDTPVSLLPSRKASSFGNSHLQGDVFVDKVQRRFDRYFYRMDISPDAPCDVLNAVRWYEHRDVSHIMNRLLPNFYFWQLENRQLLGWFEQTPVGGMLLGNGVFCVLLVVVMAVAPCVVAAVCARRWVGASCGWWARDVELSTAAVE